MDGLLGPVVGAAAVGIVTFLTTRSRSRAEVHKLDAEAEHIRAETVRLLAELPNEDHSPRVSGPLPRGWRRGGDSPDNFDVGLDRNVVFAGTASAFIASRRRTAGFETLMQTVTADAYCGKRLRLRAVVKTQEVRSWAGLWMRVDGPDGKLLTFDNMRTSRRHLSGTRDWSTYEVVLDAPDNSVAIAFGLLIAGEGKVWFDSVRLDIVSEDVPLTSPRHVRPGAPLNLDFEGGME
ncbi:hypothetical protein [Kitasatospora purpeofusca]|uniref:hypothetical protein n=1 Tax=Kitasatospora purpeofusca TaxID=67352 RepID=UPI0036A9AD2E